MTSPTASNGSVRDPVTDHLLTPQNSALIVIDYQPSQVQTVRSIDHQLLTDNIVSVARLARTFNLPVVLSTVNVANGQGHTLPELRSLLSDSREIDRTLINSWEDVAFRRAVEATGRKKLIMPPCGPRCAWHSRRSTHFAKDSRCIQWWTQSAVPHRRHTRQDSNGSPRPVRSRSAGCP